VRPAEPADLLAIVDTGGDDGPGRICGSAARAVVAALLTVTVAKHGGLPWRFRLGRKGLGHE
jgi:anthranilate phosphoribosyltransferase